MNKRSRKLSAYEDYRNRPDILVLLKNLKHEIKKNPNLTKIIPSAKSIFENAKIVPSYQPERFCEAHIEFVIQLLILYENFEIYFLARDTEYLYDIAQLFRHLNYLKHSHIHLINISRATSQTNEKLLKKYLNQQGINQQKLKNKKIVLVDSGHSGSIVHYIRNLFNAQRNRILAHFILAKPGTGIPSSRTFLGIMGMIKRQDFFSAHPETRVLLQGYETYPHPTFSSTEYKLDPIKKVLFPYGEKKLKNQEGDIVSIEKTLLLNRTIILYILFGFGDQKKKRNIDKNIQRSIKFWKGSINILKNDPSKINAFFPKIKVKFKDAPCLFKNLQNDLIEAVKLNNINPYWNNVNLVTKKGTENKILKQKINYTSLPSTNVPMKFIQIDPGIVKIGHYHQLTVSITEPFEVAQCPTTQRQWAIAMGENPSYFRNGPHTIKILMYDDFVNLQPDHPVENISWNDLQKFLSIINQLSQSNNPKIWEIFPDHKPNSFYRLPTEAERYFIVTNRGRNYSTYHFGKSVRRLKKYAHFDGKWESGSTEKVATKKSLCIDSDPRKKIFDIHGLVWEWVSDWYDYIPSGVIKNYKGPYKGKYKMIRGGGWSNDACGLRSVLRYGFHPDRKERYLGSRLVRTIKKTCE